MHHRTLHQRPETTFQVRPYELGRDAHHETTATVRINRRDGFSVTVEAGEQRWQFEGEDGLFEADRPVPRWMSWVLDYAGMTLANRDEN